MLTEEESADICFITFEDFDCSDRVLLDEPHYLNEQVLSIHKYTSPQYICSLSQFRSIDEKNIRIKRWYSIFRSLIDVIDPLKFYNIFQMATHLFKLGSGRVSCNDIIRFERKC